MTIGISIREFARRENCSETLVRRAIKQKRINALEDGSVDPELVGTAWKKSNATGVKAPSKIANPPIPSANTQQGVRTPVRTPKESSSNRPSTSGTADDDDDATLADQALKALAADGAGLDYAEALRVKENYLAMLRRLEFEQKSGVLIELTVAQSVLFEAFRAQRDAWLNWPVRIGPMLAAELGLEEADRVTEILNAYVHKQITDLGEPEGEFAQGKN